MVVAEMVVVCGRMGGLPNENGYGGVQGGVEWWKNGCGRPDVRARGPDVRGLELSSALLDASARPWPWGLVHLQALLRSGLLHT